MVRMRRRQSGFTLLELVVTLAVVSILAAIALPSFFGETRKSNASAEVQPLFSDLRVRLEEHMQEHGRYPAGAGETTWNPSAPPSTTRVPLDLTLAAWLPLKLRTSGEDRVFCRYTFQTGAANDGANIVGTEAAARFAFTAPPTEWYYLLAKCDMDGDGAVFSWYFASSVDPVIRKVDEGR